MTSFACAADLLTADPDANLGVSRWITISQDRINQFASSTEDDQWIHVDPNRAQSGPYGSTIAHGYLTLSLAATMLAEVVHVGGITAAVNCGANKVRFPSPVPVGSRVRGHVSLAAASRRGDMIESTYGLTVELEGRPSRPAWPSWSCSTHEPRDAPDRAPAPDPDRRARRPGLHPARHRHWTTIAAVQRDRCQPGTPSAVRRRHGPADHRDPLRRPRRRRLPTAATALPVQHPWSVPGPAAHPARPSPIRRSRHLLGRRPRTADRPPEPAPLPPTGARGHGHRGPDGAGRTKRCWPR